MSSLDALRNLALALGRGGFATRFAKGVLVRLGHDTGHADDADPSADSEDDTALEFDTNMVRKEDAALDLLEGDVPDPSGTIGAPIQKRRGSPWPDRISVGRAPNCDVVLRYPSVSKLHAHIRVVPTGLELSDCESSNGTFVNGRRLAPQERAAIAPGDKLRFGNIELEYMSALDAHRVLAATARRT